MQLIRTFWVYLAPYAFVFINLNLLSNSIELSLYLVSNYYINSDKYACSATEKFLWKVNSPSEVNNTYYAKALIFSGLCTVHAIVGAFVPNSAFANLANRLSESSLFVYVYKNFI